MSRVHLQMKKLVQHFELLNPVWFVIYDMEINKGHILVNGLNLFCSFQSLKLLGIHLVTRCLVVSCLNYVLIPNVLLFSLLACSYIATILFTVCTQISCHKMHAWQILLLTRIT